ncbi:MAG: NUDIX domain-containing protein [Defluviitaleaceae bacterium]|nr:NUDIX domain-containing protein [Defluviitaleaceae bacterium]MCL2224935.1 NUDIX domain-containing protein [Defluviitaleaceae bacterium]MCL2262503.1 NUDIX domain-containing protein [Defluviitaleaceae bacterium]
MECKSYPFNTLGNYIWVDIVAFHKGKWLFSKHKERTTWETQGGHIETGETPLEAAKRELYEESGAIEFDIEPLCDYSAEGIINGAYIQANSQVYIAQVHTLGEIPCDSEMERISFVDSIPDNLTYPDITNEILPIVLKKTTSNSNYYL